MNAGYSTIGLEGNESGFVLPPDREHCGEKDSGRQPAARRYRLARRMAWRHVADMVAEQRCPAGLVRALRWTADSPKEPKLSIRAILVRPLREE